MREQWFIKLLYAVHNSLRMGRTELGFFVSAVISIGIITGILTGFFWFYRNSEKELKELVSFYRIVVFLDKVDNPLIIKNVEEEILKMEEVNTFRFFKRDEVRSMIEDVFGEFPSEAGSVPLVGEVELKEEYIKGDEIRRFTKKIKKVKGISYVDAGLKQIDRLVKKTQYVKSTGLFVLLFTAIGGFVLIYAFTNLALYSVREKLNILRYVGASYWYLRLPFIIRGVIMGTVGSAFTFLILHFLPLREVMNVKMIGMMLVLYGFVSGFAGSVIAIMSHRL